MAKIYELSREGGPNSPRFQQYRARVESDWGLVPYNPMAGARTGAAAAVARLLALDVEAVSKVAAEGVVAAATFAEDMTLAVVVRAPGMWTDRVATDVQYRASPLDRPLHGLINFWSTDEISLDDVRRESAAETVRVVWSFLHLRQTNARAVSTRRPGLCRSHSPNECSTSLREGRGRRTRGRQGRARTSG